jgi:hypothetical protein
MSVILATWEAQMGAISAALGINVRPYLKNN